jgi:hypothetical protein
MPDPRSLLERELRRFAEPDDAFGRLLLRRDRQRRRKRIAAGSVGIAFFVAAVWLVVGGSIGIGHPPIPGGTTSGVTATSPSTSTERVGFVGLPPEGATPSSPVHGELVLSFYGGTTAGPQARTRVRVYADGRIIWQRDADLPFGANRTSTGFLEQRLTRKGVALLTTRVISTGLFDRDRDLSTPFDIACYNSVRSLIRGQLVRITYRRSTCTDDATRPATPRQAAVLHRLDGLLADPASWLPADAWRDPMIRPFVPSRFAVCTSTPAPVDDVLSALPPTTADLLRDRSDRISRWGPTNGRCFDLTTDDARAVVRSLELAGYQPSERDDANALTYQVADVFLLFAPYMPDGEADCGCGG